MRDIKKEEPKQGEGLFRTMAMALVIAGFMCFGAMFWPLYQGRPVGAGSAYYLSWCLPYGIVNGGIAAFGVYATTISKEKPDFYKAGSILGIVASSLLVIEAFPIVIFLKNWEMFFSVLAIGGCCLGLSILGLTSLRDNRA